MEIGEQEISSSSHRDRWIQVKERQAEGIALAKKAGKYKGRKRALTPDQVSEARQRVAAGEKKAVIARDLGIGRATLYRALAD